VLGTGVEVVSFGVERAASMVLPNVSGCGILLSDFVMKKWVYFFGIIAVALLGAYVWVSSLMSPAVVDPIADKPPVWTVHGQVMPQADVDQILALFSRDGTLTRRRLTPEAAADAAPTVEPSLTIDIHVPDGSRIGQVLGYGRWVTFDNLGLTIQKRATVAEIYRIANTALPGGD